MNSDIKQPETRQCDRCGSYDAVEAGDNFLCAECRAEAGCSCNEGDDADVFAQCG